MVFKEYNADKYIEIKIKHLKEQVKEQVNIGLELMNLLDDPNATDIINEIHRQAEEKLYNDLASHSNTYLLDSEIIFVSLVLIAMMMAIFMIMSLLSTPHYMKSFHRKRLKDEFAQY